MNIYITGASSGIGEYVSYEYAKRGNHLALCARRKEKLENIATKCREMGAEVTIYSVDVTDQHSTKESIDDFLSKITTIDLVIANAFAITKSIVVILDKKSSIDSLVEC